MKRPWDPVKLTLAYGDPPPVPSVLRMPSGRRYQVLSIGGAKTLHCLVMPPRARGQGPTIPWRWAPRKRKPRNFFSPTGARHHG